MLGVRETEVLPVKQVAVEWGGRVFGGMSFVERFEAVDAVGASRRDASRTASRPRSSGRTGKGRAIILGTFAGERNATDPVAMNPLGDLLVDWAGLDRPALKASSFVELKHLAGTAGEVVFLFNHGSEAARVQLDLPLQGAPRLIREIVTGATVAPNRDASTAAAFRLDAEIPPERARVYRIDY